MSNPKDDFWCAFDDIEISDFEDNPNSDASYADFVGWDDVVENEISDEDQQRFDEAGWFS